LIRDLILTMPAVTLADAAVQLEAALASLDSEYTDPWPHEAKFLVRRLRRVLVSTALVVKREAAIDPGMMGWPHLDQVHHHEFPPELLNVTAGMVAPTDNPDSELIALCDQLLDVVARQDALYRVRHTTEDEDRTEAQMTALFEERGDAVDQINETPGAQTDQGRAVLARAALAIGERDADGEITPRTKGESLAWLVVQSLAGVAGRDRWCHDGGDHPLPGGQHQAR
jgi:hypothetical protein